MGGGMREKKKKKTGKKHKGKDMHCLQGSSIFLITMQHYSSKAVIKMSLTAMLQAVYRYSKATRQSRRNVEETLRDSDRRRRKIKWLVWFHAIIFHTLSV